MDLMGTVHNISSNTRQLFSNPREFIKQQKQKSSLVDAIIFPFISSIIVVYSYIIFGFIGITIAGMVLGVPVFQLPILIIYGLILIGVGLIIVSVIVSVVEFIFLKLLKGKGSFTELFYLISAVLIPISLSVFAILLIIISFIGFSFMGSLFLAPYPMDRGFFSPIGLSINTFLIVESVVTFYILTQILREVGQFNTKKAVLCWLMPLVVFCCLWLATNQVMHLLEKHDIIGFSIMKPDGAGVASLNGTRAQIHLPLTNYGGEALFNKTSVSVTKEGRKCKITGINTLSSKNPGDVMPITLPSYMHTWVFIEVSGEGCSGVVGETYSYEISWFMNRNGEILDNSGQIKGRYEAFSPNTKYKDYPFVVY